MFNFVVTGTVWSNLTDPEDCHIMMDIPNRSFQVLCSICANQCFLTDSQLQYMYLNCTLTSVAKYLMMFIQIILCSKLLCYSIHTYQDLTPQQMYFCCHKRRHLKIRYCKHLISLVYQMFRELQSCALMPRLCFVWERWCF